MLRSLRFVLLLCLFENVLSFFTTANKEFFMVKKNNQLLKLSFSKDKNNDAGRNTFSFISRRKESLYSHVSLSSEQTELSSIIVKASTGSESESAPKLRKNLGSSQEIDGEKEREIVNLYDWHSTITTFQDGWGFQKKLVEEKLEHKKEQLKKEKRKQKHREQEIKDDDDENIKVYNVEKATEDEGKIIGKNVDSLILLQHRATYTLGTGSTESNMLFSKENPPKDCDIFRTERGGEVTFHGPGQLVLYPIFDLSKSHYQTDLHWYVRQLEEVVILTLKKLGIHSRNRFIVERIDGMTGVWVNGEKIAAIGVKVRKWVTMHGTALNVCTDLSHFAKIIPCGIEGKAVTSVVQTMELEFEKNQESEDNNNGDEQKEVDADLKLILQYMKEDQIELMISLVANTMLEAASEIFHLEYNRINRIIE